MSERPAAPTPSSAAVRSSPAVIAICDGLLTATVIVLAVWTIVFVVAVALHWSQDVALAIWLVAVVAVAAWLHRTRRPGTPIQLAPISGLLAGRMRPLVVFAITTAIVASALSATSWPSRAPRWWVFWALVVASLGVAAFVVVRTPSTATVDGPPLPSTDGRWGTVLVLAIAALFAIGSAVTQRPDADDVFLVNLSVYIEQHGGDFPTRDTIFSDEVFRSTRPEVPQTSIEPLVGVVARYTPWTAPTLTYLVLGPIAAGLSILALWRVLRTVGAAAPGLATAFGALFLLLDGEGHAAFGNLSFGRSWQGKVIFLIVITPLLVHHGLRWARDGSRRDLALLVAGNVAGLGLTRTAAFIAPTVTIIAVGAGALACRRWREVAWATVACIPALLFVLAGALFDPPPDRIGGAIASGDTESVPLAASATSLDPGVQWHFVFGDGGRLFIPVAAVLLGWVFVRDRSARLFMVLAPLTLFGVFYAPRVLPWLAEPSGAGSILWRVAWLLPLPMAVGLAATAPLLVSRERARAWPDVRRPGTPHRGVGGNEHVGARLSERRNDRRLATVGRRLEVARGRSATGGSRGSRGHDPGAGAGRRGGRGANDFGTRRQPPRAIRDLRCESAARVPRQRTPSHVHRRGTRSGRGVHGDVHRCDSGPRGHLGVHSAASPGEPGRSRARLGPGSPRSGSTTSACTGRCRSRRVRVDGRASRRQAVG